ncbi:N-acetyl-gamma-glutamyl-phosphate reductase [Reinekea marinisedimentorum]|uniref:N-acetyl-gamma-glutamyl-phosphate reductase n=1 Tax=Reinekea marinisedimentorum TaxID=230495 RepID=A0A4R3IDF1_9GAMM|nr:N-acetyl-gamma-glutamyl-phosphate reductase [Reinekea marinisedimentorum]TCS43796.1 N-acetyl-gamma-glutamyl-phosphate reductase [Reinekea marinisedimentorum]
MSKITAYIDGQYGTTGLQIQERLSAHPNVDVLSIPEEQKKDPELRREFLNKADVVFLCLPDDASREAVTLIDNPETVVIDASTAFRVNPDWVYGIPELPGYRDKIKTSNRIANPGCYPSGMTLLIAPLVEAGIVPKSYAMTVSAITGYSGGGKAMIADYKTKQGEAAAMASARLKNLDLNHKHLPEMTRVTGLEHAPVFVPTVANVEQGMLVSVALHGHAISGDAEKIHATLASTYAGEPFVKLFPLNDESQLEEGFLEPTACNGTNRIELFVFSSEDRIYLTARLDNLGKGASGAAVQNMNCRFGIDETTGLTI